MAVDGDAATYWASEANGAAGPVTFTVDMGEVMRIQDVEIAWEFPPKAFAVALSADGASFSGAYSTNTNVVAVARVPVRAAARAVRITMSEERSAPRVDWAVRVLRCGVPMRRPTLSWAWWMAALCLASGASRCTRTRWPP